MKAPHSNTEIKHQHNSVRMMPSVRPIALVEHSGRRPSMNARVGMPIALCVIQLILAYEWLISGINKVVNPNFAAQLPGTLRGGMNGNPYGWYVDILRTVVLPHATLFAYVAEVSEVGIGVALLAGAALWIWRPTSRVTHMTARFSGLVLGGAALLSLNYFFQGGSTFPWINSANAFNEGVDIDILLPLLSLTLAVSNLRFGGEAINRLVRRNGTDRTYLPAISA